MALQNLSRVLVSSSVPPRCPSPASPRPIHRRLPVIGALWILGLGTVSSLAYTTGCVQSIRHFPFARSKFVNQPSSRGLQSAAMASASTTVPSIVVYVTVPNKEAGRKLAESIIKEKLAACVNRVPGIESVYWWDGKVQTDSEELLIIKTRESLLGALTEHVNSNHEYDVPEVVALPITGGSEKYLEWIKNSTKDK